MRVKINNVADKTHALLVFFCCSVGKGCGIWNSSVIPDVDSLYSVEIDIEKSLTELRYEILTTEKNEIDLVNNHIQLTANIEDIEDGICYLRLSSDCLIMVDIGEEQLYVNQILQIILEYGDVRIFMQ